MNRFRFTLLISCLFFLSCQDSTLPTEPKKVQPISKSNASGTAEMVKILNQLDQELSHEVVFFRNKEKSRIKLDIGKKSTDFEKQIQNYVESAYNMINSNSNEDAINVLTKLIVALKGKANDTVVYPIERLLALAYIRLGEQTNCLNRTTDESCLMPIKGNGIYTVKEAVKSAIQIYEGMLERRPDDKESIWMLNFAYMTLGEFPQNVPVKWRLSEELFKSDTQIPKFKNISSKVGLNTVGLSGGMAMEDFDNDGFLDIMASSWGLADQLKFFKNNGDGTFTDKTVEAKLTGLTGGLNMQHADYNNDGFMDVLILRGAWLKNNGKIPNSLLKNNGDGTFSDVTKEAGVLSFLPTQAAVWADFNLDGWLDLFIGNESEKKISTKCELYISNQDGTFTNQIHQSNLGDLTYMVKGTSAADLDNDGYPDLYVSALGKPNLLFKNNGPNQDGIPQFENRSATSNTTLPIMSFPTWIWDFDNDGWMDIFIATVGLENNINTNAASLAAQNYSGNTPGAHPRIYKNNQNFTFTDNSAQMGITEGMLAMGCNYGDLNNDGFDDFYLGTGNPTMTAIVPNKMFLNSKGKRFLDVTTAAEVGHIQKGHAVGFGDLDNDGDQDIFCVLGGAFDGDIFGDALFLNPFGNEKNWISIKLEGTSSNRGAVGARIKLTAQKPDGSNLVLHKYISTGSSFGGNSLQAEIGLDDATVVKSIEVIWPNKEQTKTIIENIEINKFYKLKEGSNQLEEINLPKLNF